MKDIVLGMVLMIALIASGYSIHSFYKTFHAAGEEAGFRLRRAAMIVSLCTIAGQTAMAVVCIILLYLYNAIGMELVITFAILYAIVMAIVVFAARKSRYSGQIGDIHKRIIIELIIYSGVLVLTFAVFMFGVFSAK